MGDHPWRPPVEEALAMADAFREGVPLGYQRAFVVLADAYRDVLADHANLADTYAALLSEHRLDRASTPGEIRFAGQTGLPTYPAPPADERMATDEDLAAASAQLDQWLDAATGNEPRPLTDDEAAILGSWAAPKPDPLAPFAYAIDKKAIADADRLATRVLVVALALALTVAGFVHFFG
jgi:hypothetical protein